MCYCYYILQLLITVTNSDRVFVPARETGRAGSQRRVVHSTSNFLCAQKNYEL